MSAKIVVGGVEITVDVKELGEAMRQLAPLLALPPQQRHPDVVHAQHSKPAQTSAAPSASQLKGESARQQALKFFSVLSEYRASGGAKSEEVMTALGASHVKGIGSKMTPINTFLQFSGFEPTDVYKNDRDATGSRMWTAGERFDEAWQKLQEQSAEDLVDLL